MSMPLPGMAGASLMLATGDVLASGSDPYWTSTILLCGCEGVHGAAANLVDESFAAHAAGTAGGSGMQDAFYNDAAHGGVLAAAGNSYAVFGSGGVRNDYVRFADHADWTLGSNSFTLEMFIYFNNSSIGGSGTGILMSHYNNIGDQRGWHLYTQSGVFGFVRSFDGLSIGGIASANQSPSIQTWYYLCIERSGNDFRLYFGPKGGTASMIGSETNSGSIFNSNAVLQLSGTPEGETECLDDTFLDEIRLTTVARYATDAGYPVPSQAFPRQ